MINIYFMGGDVMNWTKCVERCRNLPVPNGFLLEERLLAIGFNTIFDYLFLQGDQVTRCVLLELDWLV